MVEMQPAPEGPVDPAMAPSPSPKDADRERFRRRRVLWGAVGVVVVLALLLGTGGWLWWTHPSTTRDSLPAGVEGGETVRLADSLPPRQTRTGALGYDSLRSERHQWIASVRWTPTGEKSTVYELHLGESTSIDGLGTVTLVAVTPPSTSPPDKSKAGGARERVHVNVNLDPGIQWCRPSDSC